MQAESYKSFVENIFSNSQAAFQTGTYVWLFQTRIVGFFVENGATKEDLDRWVQMLIENEFGAKEMADGTRYYLVGDDQRGKFREIVENLCASLGN
jgi:hypothetical protein